MKISGITTFLHSLVVLSFIFFVGLFLSVDSIVAFDGAIGGDGIAGPGDGGDYGYISGRFFNDEDGNGIKEGTEALISNHILDCSNYTGPKMVLSNLYVSINGENLYPKYCDYVNPWEYGPFLLAPEYLGTFSIGNKTITTHIPSGWRCSTSSACTQTVNLVLNNIVIAQPIGIKKFCSGPMANIDSWEDDPLVASGGAQTPTKIRARHIEQLRLEIDRRRADAWLPAFSWTDPTITPNVTKISKRHIEQLRAAISEVYSTCNQTPLPSWTDPTITANVTKIKATHIMELRQRTADAK